MAMSPTTRRPSVLAALAACLVGLGALAVPLPRAAAQDWVGVQVGPFGFGLGPPYYGYPYYPPSASYPPYPYDAPYPYSLYPPNDFYPPR